MKILVAAHDAGGAEILSALCKKYRAQYEWEIYAAGPAKKSFQSKPLRFVSLKKWDLPGIRKKIQKAAPDLLITGTGWGSSLERNFMEAARFENLRSGAYLDGWFNFRERFASLSRWRDHLPDYVFVGDNEAYRLAIRNGFPKTSLNRIENPFWEFAQTETRAHEKNGRPHLLYVMQPGQKTYQNWMRRLCFRAGDILIYPNLFFQSLGAKKAEVFVRLRPHPSEATDKITKYIQGLRTEGYCVEKSRPGTSIFDDLQWSDAVVGLESMALVLGLAMGKKAISYLPGKQLHCRLPHQEVKKIRDPETLCREIFKSSAMTGPGSFLARQRRFNKRFSLPRILKGLSRE